MSTMYHVTESSQYIGPPLYSFEHEGRWFFRQRACHTGQHAKKEAQEYLAAIGIEVGLSQIEIKWDGCMA